MRLKQQIVLILFLSMLLESYSAFAKSESEYWDDLSLGAETLRATVSDRDCYDQGLKRFLACVYALNGFLEYSDEKYVLIPVKPEKAGEERKKLRYWSLPLPRDGDDAETKKYYGWVARIYGLWEKAYDRESRPIHFDYAVNWVLQRVPERKWALATGYSISSFLSHAVDPFASIKPSAYMQAQLNERPYLGIGVALKSTNRGVSIDQVLPNGPAGRAGVRPGDKILAIDGYEYAHATSASVQEALSGVSGKSVSLVIERQYAPMPFDMIIEEVQPKSVTGFVKVWRKKRIGYIQISSFTAKTTSEVHKHLKKWRSVEGLVIDLRGNPGLSFGSALTLVDYFTPKGAVIVTEQPLPAGDVVTHKSSRNPGSLLDKVVVLVDSDTASAAEIFAGSMQSHGALVAGFRTFGKGTIQDWRSNYAKYEREIGDDTLPPGLAIQLQRLSAKVDLSLTTGRFNLPDGRGVTKAGVEPDVPLTDSHSFRYRLENAFVHIDADENSEYVPKNRVLNKRVQDCLARLKRPEVEDLNFYEGMDAAYCWIYEAEKAENQLKPAVRKPAQPSKTPSNRSRPRNRRTPRSRSVQ